MKVLQKFSLVLLLASSYSAYAMHGFGEPEIGSWEHAQDPRNAHMYDSDGLSQHVYLRPEYEPENIQRTLEAQRQAKLAAEVEEARLTPRLQAQAAREGISVAELKIELERERSEQDYYRSQSDNEPSTIDEILNSREQMSAQKEAQAAERLKVLSERDFKRPASRILTPEEVAAERERQALMARRREFEREYFKEHPDHYQEDPYHDASTHGGMSYVLRPEYRAQYEQGLASIR